MTNRMDYNAAAPAGMKALGGSIIMSSNAACRRP